MNGITTMNRGGALQKDHALFARLILEIHQAVLGRDFILKKRESS